MKPTKIDLTAAEKALGAKLVSNGKYTQALHDVVVALQANRRAGTHSTLTKGTVSYSGAKPWRQKGTGRARAGYKSSPVWVGGGVAFGPHPRDYSKKTSKKVKKIALKKAISETAKSGRLYLSEYLKLTAPKTREFAKWLQEAAFSDSVLVITLTTEKNLLLASRNVPRVHVLQAQQVNAEDLLLYKDVVILKEALPLLAKRLE